MSYASEVLQQVIARNPGEHQFHQAVTEVFETLEPVFTADSIYQKKGILEMISEPDRAIMFKVPWVDDAGNVCVNKGYRVQFNNAIGPYKGGLRFHPSVCLDVIKFLGFEQIFKNSLTGLPMGGGKGGSDFDPKGKSDREVMAFCQSFMTALSKYVGADIDVPAGDIGVGAREIGYMYGQYKRLTTSFEGVLTGKGLSFGGSLIRKEATGYGLVYLTNQLIVTHGMEMKGKRVVISGSGNVAIYAAEKVAQLGGIPVTMSDSNGWIYDPDGIDLVAIKQIKEVERKRISEYINYRPSAEYHTEGKVWDIACDIALPCATQNELDEAHAKTLIDNGIKAICEGANMPNTPQAIEAFQNAGVLFVPGKASNAGGVATSGLEMTQNSMRLGWTEAEVDAKLQGIMENIYKNIAAAAEAYGKKGDYVAGANIAGFLKVADAMIAQGVV